MKACSNLRNCHKHLWENALHVAWMLNAMPNMYKIQRFVLSIPDTLLTFCFTRVSCDMQISWEMVPKRMCISRLCSLRKNLISFFFFFNLRRFSLFILGNSCDRNNGDCEYLCVPLVEGRRCSCKEGMELEQNGKKCKKHLQGKSRS